MARHHKPTLLRAPAAKQSRHHRKPSPDDSILDTDSEVDEFVDGHGNAHAFAGEKSGIDSEASDGTDERGAEEETEGEDDMEGVGRWEPDDWDTDEDDGGEDAEVSDQDDQSDVGELRKLQNDLTSLPFSTLLLAQRSLHHRSISRSSSPEVEPSSLKDQRVVQIKAKLAEMQRRKGKAEAVHLADEVLDHNEGDSSREHKGREEDKRERPKRESKHAPTAMSSKRQVSRMRKVVDLQKPERRDPRFSSVSAGKIDPHLHTKAYEFLPDLLRTELKDLRTAVTVAKKAERTCSWAEKPTRAIERERLEGELGRLRTKLERTERETRERDVLATVKKEEREKRKQGKGEWFMKKGEKRDLLLKSRFDALQQQGGKTAVKKAIEKKRKKSAGKEKKSRPFAKGQEGRQGSGRIADGPAFKRRRVR